MKLRQKLAAVLATAMIVTAVPVVTFAASANRTTSVAQVTKNTVLTDSIAPELVLELKDGITSESTFYVTLENATWEKDTMAAASTKEVEFKATDSELAVTVKTDKIDEVRIPMLAKVKEGEAKAIIEGNKFITGGTYVFANTQTGNVTVKIGDVPSFYSDGGTLAPIELTETVIGALAAEAKGTEGKETLELRLALDSNEFEFVSKGTNGIDSVTVAGDRGFTTKITPVSVDVDKDELTIEIAKKDLQIGEKGRITLKDINVKTSKKAPTTGELNVTLISDIAEDKDYKVANIAEYGTSITVKDDKVVEIKEGRQEKVTFTLKQTVKDSVVQGRTIDFTVDGGYIFGTQETLEAIVKDKGLTVTDVTFKDDKAEAKIITGFTVKVDKVEDKYEFANVPVVAMLGTEGDITLKAEGRAIGQEIETVIAKSTAAIKVETESVKLEVGVREQKGGKVTITETDKAEIEKGDLVITLDKEDGLNFTDIPEVKVTSGDLKVDKAELIKEDGTVVGIKIPVTRQSREASTIEISGFPVKIDRTVPDGEYKLEVGGSALAYQYETKNDKDVVTARNFGKKEVKDFFIIGEGIATKVTTTITADATAMKVNGKEVALEAPAFLEKGKMMVPLRAVAEAFGIPSKDITYSNGTIVVFANGRTISLTIGSTDAFVNGAKMVLGNPAKIVNERTVVPVGDLGRMLGLEVKWDGATKTATFNN